MILHSDICRESLDLQNGELRMLRGKKGKQATLQIQTRRRPAMVMLIIHHTQVKKICRHEVGHEERRVCVLCLKTLAAASVQPDKFKDTWGH